MKIVKLKDVAIITTGKTPSKSSDIYYLGGTIPFVKPPNLIGSEEIITTEEYLTIDGAKQANIIPKYSIMVSCIGSLGKVGIAGSDLVTNQQINSLTFNSDLVNYKYGYYFSLTLARKLKQIANSAVVPIVNKTTFSNLDFILYSIEEQKKIVEILDKAEELRKKRTESLILLDSYLKSVFLEMFGDPIINTHHYKETTLKFLIDNIQAGWSAQGENRKIARNEFGVLKISAVTSGFFRPTENKYVKDITEKKLVKPEKGDLLFSRANTRELVAATCVVDASYDTLFLPDKLWKITPKKDVANEWFLHFLISYDRFRDILRGKATGTSGSMLNISQQKFLETICYVPPIELQNKFAKIVSETELLKQKMVKQSEGLEEQFHSLMQKSFSIN